ncbi:hypothetical protein DVH24_033240 [Malus domestica]|uniref:Disease resistance R13L4/SHOC-2-like LRR domain-containing protein n=1 Tax=Malus domestica TaxID=3750 RepID=A0A498JE65_MALDO|nr:hypothetical protein DVH24_033240 [Malus domestica]
MDKLIGLDLSGSKIKELPSSINCLTGLRILILKDCKELKTLPSSICQLQSLYYLSLSGCTKFEVFPNIEENMEELRALHLDGTSIKELPPSIERLQQLVLLNLGNCESLVHLPDTFCNLARPLAVNLSGCTNLSQFPVDYEDLARLWDYQGRAEFDTYITLLNIIGIHYRAPPWLGFLSAPTPQFLETVKILLCHFPLQIWVKAAGKGSHENFSSGSYGGVGEEDQSIQQLRFKAASLSFSSVSSRKKMKPNEPNIRIPKSS